ncbi:zinc finger CCCH domain-containing protein 15 [Carica papaya]|uniref:zinc finger CCCH domain-containing protein 15 n=1 Tax=Carica papaya TaxID=3649 RepID=UPI000B8CF913|nr:zinc finger CCCH domain-containing protein 15 [Carica papaya]
MQNDTTSTTYGDYTTDAATTTTMKFQDQQFDGGVMNSLYSSSSPMFSPETSLSLAPYLDPSYQQSRLLMQQHQDMVNRHALSLSRLSEAEKEAESLRLENARLRSVNRELNKQLSILIRASVQNHFISSSDFESTPFDVLNGFRSLSICGGDDQEHAASWEDVCDESPTSVIERVDGERTSLPKSISIRSNGYLKMSVQNGNGHGGRSTRGATRPGTSGLLNETQKVYVHGGKKEEEPLELEVYNQGMFKTELCNKWQETGSCPYGDHCQFAHGIEELRPVIRHPRYKTEVCRMVLAGDVCPYGHRCHFRHALTEQERFMGQVKPRAIKLER